MTDLKDNARLVKEKRRSMNIFSSSWFRFISESADFFELKYQWYRPNKSHIEVNMLLLVTN